MKVQILSFLFFLTSTHPSQAQLWEQVGAELGPISHLFVDTVTNTLYAGGVYYSAVGDTVKGLSIWNGTNWSMEAPVEGSFFANDIVSYNGEIIVGGNIPSMGHLAKWDGENWGPVGTILEDLQPIYSIKDLHVFNGDLIVGGMIFPFPSNTDAVGLVRFDGTFWYDMDTDTINAWVPPGVIEMCDYNGELYIAGKFSIQTDQPYAYNIAKWDSESWQPVGHGIGLTPSEFPVRSFAEYQGELYIGGNFGPEMFYYTNSRYIVKWNGSEYSALAEEEPCCILDMVAFKSELYVLGTFEQNSELGKTDFAKWDGSKWCSLGSVFNGTAYDLEIYNGELYAAGLFFDINGEPFHSVVKWVGGDYVETCGTPVSEVQTHREKGGNLILSPNPATSFISISAEHIAATATLVAHNLLGQPVLQRALLPSNGEVRETVDVSAWPPGVYFFTLRAGGQVWSEKAVIRE